MRRLCLVVVLCVACGGGKAVGPADAAEVGDFFVDRPYDDAQPESAVDQVQEVVVSNCLGQLQSDKIVTLQGIHAPVEVVYDKYGIPHIFAQNEEDLFFAEGFIVAKDRIVQMQGMRLITQGRFSSTSAASASDLNTDVYMRIMNFRAPAEAMWTNLQANHPEIARILQAFSEGVTAFIEAAKQDYSLQPLEWSFLGHWEPWTPVDSLILGRLQSWDLSFSHYTDEISMAANLAKIMENFKGTPFEGLLVDAYRAKPATNATILEPVRSSRPARLASPRNLISAFPKGYFERLQSLLETVQISTLPAAGGGSNNWVVSGKYTKPGSVTLAGDPHLALRNPSVFYQVHLNTTLAGGDLDLAGVCFPGIPGIILGHSQHGAWMGTVHNYDVTDVYIEKFAPDDPNSVIFKGNKVPLNIRKETIAYNKPAGGCESWVQGLAKEMDPQVKEDGEKCLLTVTILEVPHHGPIIPGSRVTLNDGTAVALAWRWTGFEPSEDIVAVVKLWKAKTAADFLEALRHFGVGAQNWVWGGKDGHIAYAAWARVPVRKHVKEGNGYEYPPWLPMPGDGCCEWVGDVPTEELPHVVDPASGFIATANNDAVGTTLDNDPLNDKYYFAHTYDIGFRGARVLELLQQKVSQGSVTTEDFQAIQADHKSPFGAELTWAIIDAIAEGEKAADGEQGAEQDLAPLIDNEVLQAKARLASWDFMTPSGLENEASQNEKASSIAASIFNAWLVFLYQNIFENKGLLGLESQFAAKLILAMVNEPESLATYEPAIGDTVLWDDLSTMDKIESRRFIILKSLKQALAFLKDPSRVGPSQKGGFGIEDMEQWLWGKLHTVTLRHALGGEANIPPQSQYPDGFPRHGDNFVVDSCNPGFNDTSFTYSHGPAMRAVYVIGSQTVQMQNAIPGGQTGSFPSAHYNDDFFLWARNQTHPVFGLQEDILQNAEACLILRAQPL